MELKISVKTILLFTALFILGTMILGFYSCSGGSSTPVSPQLTEEFTEEEPFAPDDVTLLTDDVNTTTVVTEDGTTIVTYIVTIDEYGNLIFTTRESTGLSPVDGGDIISSLVTLDFTDFVVDGPVWTGTATVTNNTSFILSHPRVAIGGIFVDPPVDLNTDFDMAHIVEFVQDPDIYCTVYAMPVEFTPAALPVASAIGFPAIFIADEDENYQIDAGDSASHDISILYEGIPDQTFEVRLMYQFVSTVTDTLGVDASKVIPTGIDIVFDEYVDEVSIVNVTFHCDGLQELRRTCLVEIADPVDTTIFDFAFSGLNVDNEPVFTGSIPWDPSVDPPIDIMAYSPAIYFLAEPVYDEERTDAYMDYTTLP